MDNEIQDKTATSLGFKFDTSYTNLPKFLFTHTNPSPVPNAELLVGNEFLANELGFDSNLFSNDELINALGGNGLINGSTPIAQAYAGHQFGHFAILGDGRAILLGEHITPTDDRFDIQLKGSGETPYSRRGDGKAAVGPMLREYIISESMHALNIPTTRSLAVISTGSPVYREYPQPGAVLTRVAKSHLRVGTFQFAAFKGTVDDMRQLVDYTLDRHFPKADRSGNRSLTLLKEVILQQAKLIAQWQLVGFIHGVMNTDNMSICGETIDYGPCAFMDIYNPETVFSSIDSHGRYAYGNQPSIAQWNLTRFAETMLPLFHETQDTAIEIATNALEQFTVQFDQFYMDGMRKKIGLFTAEQSDESLISDLLTIMQATKSDFTNTFRNLADLTNPAFEEWKTRWSTRKTKENRTIDEVQTLMNAHNPVIIPRNNLVESALRSGQKNGDLSLMNRLLAALQSPFEYNEEYADLYVSPPVQESYSTFCGT